MNNAITTRMVSTEIIKVFSKITKIDITKQLEKQDNTTYLSIYKEPCNEKDKITMEFLNKKIEIIVPSVALLLSLNDFSSRYIVPAIEGMPEVKKILARNNKLLHMKRKLSCKSKIKIIH